MTSPLKEHVLSFADKLFYAEGVRAVGVDRIIAESGVAKASFYRLFHSKDQLLIDWIRKRDVEWRQWLADSVDMLSPQPDNRPVAVFDALYARFRSPQFRGCAFLNTIVELAPMQHPAANAAREHKRSVIGMLETWVSEAGYVEVETVALHVMQLVDGAIVTALREEQPDAALRAKKLAQLYLNFEVRQPVANAGLRRS